MSSTDRTSTSYLQAELPRFWKPTGMFNEVRASPAASRILPRSVAP